MLQIPTVTQVCICYLFLLSDELSDTLHQDDLNAFHARTFGPAAPLPDFPFTGPSTCDEDIPDLTTQWEDNLGYYPDGNKRTLTDNQIAMFRHSEIYSILREKQVRKENEEADADDAPKILGTNVEAESGSLMPLKVEEETEDATEIYDEENESISAAQVDLTPLSVNKKRKRNTADNGDRSGAFTSRRLARELDSASAQDTVLDYGDGPTEDGASMHVHPREASPDHSGTHEGEKISIKGRKIWWPAIEAT